MVNYYSVEAQAFKYFRAPDSQMVKKPRELLASSFVNITFYKNVYYFNKPMTNVQYSISVYPNKIYTHYHYITCSCHYYYKSFNCKHVVRVSDLYGYKIKGYTKVKVFAINSKRGAKRKNKKTNCLNDD